MYLLALDASADERIDLTEELILVTGQEAAVYLADATCGTTLTL